MRCDLDVVQRARRALECSVAVSTIALATICIACAGYAEAATFTVSCNSKTEQATRSCTIKLTGKIEDGDSARLRATIRSPMPAGFHFNTLLLDSPGGDVGEALRIASVVREAMLETTTMRRVTDIDTEALRRGDKLPRMHWRCVSACFLVWVAGAERTSFSAVDPEHGPVGIGLHRPYFAPAAYNNPASQVAEMQQQAAVAIREYLRREQIPESFIEKMLDRSSREVYWLHESGDQWALNGRAAWFEEMMIARCSYDPVYDRQGERHGVELVKKRKDPLTDAAYRKYLSWRQAFNGCKHEVRRSAQQAIRESK
ncbi:MAG: hypothetical protein ACOY5V_06185 [Pseudomonadota bacterium]